MFTFFKYIKVFILFYIDQIINQVLIHSICLLKHNYYYKIMDILVQFIVKAGPLQ